MDHAIEFDRVSKIYQRTTGRQLLRSHLESLLRRRKKEPFHALKRISFKLAKSRSLAVVGPNGAGKSTLLSLAAGLSEPDEGHIRVNGKVAALLELGTGFHPDLSGAENVYLNASLIGLSRKATRSRFEEIVEFSGIGEFINDQLRTYSTGMVMRLAFSVAISVDPDVLILDEVFAVGDQNFQARCKEKIHGLRRAGKTIICVSHAAGTLRELCDEAIWLDQGELIMSGQMEEVVAAYEGQTASRQT